MAIDPSQVPPPQPAAPFPPAPAAPQGPSRLKRVALGCGGAIGLVIVLFFAVFLYQMWQASSLLESAKAMRAAANYEGSVSDLLTLIADYKSFDEAKEATTLLPEVRLDWAKALREQGKFEDSLARYDEISSPEQTEKVATGKLETHLAWGGALVGEKKFDDALTHYSEVLNKAPKCSDLAQRAVDALPDAYVGLADTALASGDAATSFKHLSFVFDNYPSGPGYEKAVASFANLAQPLYDLAQQQRTSGQYADADKELTAITTHAPNSALAQQVQGAVPAFYYEWGQALPNDKQYDEAVKVYKLLLKTYPESEAAKQAQTAMIDAEVAGIASSGQAGALPAPEAAGSSGAELATYEITNDTVCPLTVLMSGPQSQAVKLDPKTTNKVDIAAGSYQVVVKINDELSQSDACSNVTPYTGATPFESGMIYSSSFYIETTSR